jgi:hypothetical protein
MKVYKDNAPPAPSLICVPDDYWRSIDEYGPTIEISRDGRMFNSQTRKFTKALAADVATAFLPNPGNLEHVRFLDANESNVALVNIRWSRK